MTDNQNMSAIVPGNLYEIDFYAWTQQQAQRLQQGNWHGLDITNLVEEIECLGKQQKQELRNRLGILIGHLLKWEYQPQQRSRSWMGTIREQRQQIQLNLRDNPSLKSYLPEAIVDGWDLALTLLLRETRLPLADLPAQCSYTLEQLLDRCFPPDLSQEL